MSGSKMALTNDTEAKRISIAACDHIFAEGFVDFISRFLVW